jgi:hypothetical protein
VTAPTSTDSEALPVYKSGDVPDHLRTTTQLKAQRLKPADGQQPVAFLRMYRRGHGWGEFPLYEPGEAAPMRPLSAKQQEAMTARRTCPQCGEVRGYVVHRKCGECAETEQREHLEWLARRCVWCYRVSAAPHPPERSNQCEPCWLHREIRRQAEEERRAVWRRTCPGRDCTKVTATDEEIAAGWDEDAAQALRSWGWSPRWCPPCKERDEQERAERQRAYEEAQARAEEDRRRRVAELVAWAAEVLADPSVVVLDCETTGLHDEARMLDLAVTNAAGDVLVNTLLDPSEAIPAEATGIHGITDEMVKGAPSFGAALDELTAVLGGRRCLIYNKPYDVGRLRHELTVHYRQAGHPDPAASAAAWLEAVRFEDVMLPYSEWVGDWSDYHGDYAWQSLTGGGHRALSDCRAVVETLRGMVATAAAA